MARPQLLPMLVSLVVFALAAFALASPAAAAGGKLGTIDLNKVLDQLEEKTFRERQLETFLKNLEDGVNETGKQLKQARDELNILPKNTPSYFAKREEVLRMSARLQADAQAAKLLAEEKKKSLQVDLYEKIGAATAEFSKKNGYDLVVVDDSMEKIPEDASPQQAQAAMVNRRVMFASPDIDISDAVAAQMNNEFKASGMGAAPPAPPAPAAKPN